jgi:hypothetical protein
VVGTNNVIVNQLPAVSHQLRARESTTFYRFNLSINYPRTLLVHDFKKITLQAASYKLQACSLLLFTFQPFNNLVRPLPVRTYYPFSPLLLAACGLQLEAVFWWRISESNR